MFLLNEICALRILTKRQKQYVETMYTDFSLMSHKLCLCVLFLTQMLKVVLQINKNRNNAKSKMSM